MKRFRNLFLSILGLLILVSLCVGCSEDFSFDVEKDPPAPTYSGYVLDKTTAEWKKGDRVLPASTEPYIAVVNNGLLKEIHPLASVKEVSPVEVNVGYGYITRDSSSDTIKYINRSGKAQEIIIKIGYLKIRDEINLSFDCPKDTVSHFGEADNVVIDSVASDSFYEYGTVNESMTIHSGHVVLKNGSDVNIIKFDTESFYVGSVAKFALDVEEGVDQNSINLEASPELLPLLQANGVELDEIVGSKSVYVSDDEGDKYYNNIVDAFARAKTGATVQLLKDSTVSDTALVGSDKTFVLDLNEKKLSYNGETELTPGIIDVSGTLGITGNGSIDAGEYGKSVISLTGTGGQLVIENGTFKGLKAIYATDQQAIVLIKDGAFDGEISIVDDTTAVINGGTFSDLTGASKYVANGKEIKLLKDLDNLAARIDLTANTSYTIDLNGKTLVSTSTCKNGSVFNVLEGTGTITLKNGILTGVEATTTQAAPYDKECDVITVRSGATLNVENLDISLNSQNGACFYAFDGATINIKSGTFENSAENVTSSNPAFTAMLVNQANVSDQLIFVSGGTFKGQNPATGDDSGTPSTFLAEGYKYELKEGSYVVSPGTDD